MKLVYPVIISKEKSDNYYDVYIPDLEVNTEGETIADAIEMARDAIGLKCLTLDEDNNKSFPKPSELNKIKCNNNEFVTLVDVDYSEYKKQYSTKAVRRNVTLPSWINYEAEKSGVNVSAILANALKEELHLSDRKF
jgi:predicted RNase H-like HicB family nuclease